MPMNFRATRAIDAPTGSDTFAYHMADVANLARMPITVGKTDEWVRKIQSGEGLLSQHDCQFCRAARSQCYPECLAFCEYMSGASLTGQLASMLQLLPGILDVARGTEETITGSYIQVHFSHPDTDVNWAKWGEGMGVDVVDVKESTTTPAQQLQRLSGLDQATLARILGVTRQTYNNWALKNNARGRNLKRLLEVLSFAEEAEKRLGNPVSVKNWLLTPVSPGEVRPIDLLEARDHEVCKGLLLQLRTGAERVRPIEPLVRDYRSLKPEEFEDAREEVNPGAWPDDE